MAIIDKRYPDLRKLLKAAGYKQNIAQSRLNQGRKDELFTDAYVYENDHDSMFVRPNSGTVLDFTDYQWHHWLEHAELYSMAKEMGLLKIQSTDVSLDETAFQSANLELFGA